METEVNANKITYKIVWLATVPLTCNYIDRQPSGDHLSENYICCIINIKMFRLQLVQCWQTLANQVQVALNINDQSALLHPYHDIFQKRNIEFLVKINSILYNAPYCSYSISNNYKLLQVTAVKVFQILHKYVILLMRIKWDTRILHKISYKSESYTSYLI